LTEFPAFPQIARPSQGGTEQSLRLDSRVAVIPEISCNRLMVSVRFMSQESDGRLHTSTGDTVFELTLCS
jgi:cell division FtsZ-interacting protein ZapD